jgi:transposase
VSGIAIDPANRLPAERVHRFNQLGPDGPTDDHRADRKQRLSAEQKAELARIVEQGPDLAVDGVVRRLRVDLKRVIEQRFGVALHERYVGKLLEQMGFSHVSARPRHPAQDGEIVEAY